MTQNDLNRAVSRATGETVATVKRIGFLIEEPPIVEPDDAELGPQVIDWDELDAARLEQPVAA